MKFKIELDSGKKSLLHRAEFLIKGKSPWSDDLIRAINTVNHALSVSVDALNFALSVLDATIQDAETTRKEIYASDYKE